MRIDDQLGLLESSANEISSWSHLIVSSGRPSSGTSGLVACVPSLHRWELAYLGVRLRKFFLHTVINAQRGTVANGVLTRHRIWARTRLEAVMKERIFVDLNGMRCTRGAVICPPLTLKDMAYLFLVRLGRRPSPGLLDTAQTAEDSVRGDDHVRLTFHHRAVAYVDDHMLYSVDVPLSMLNP